MKWLDNVKKSVKRWWRGTPDEAPAPTRTPRTTRNPFLKDAGPATRRYLKIRITNEVGRGFFTKRLTHCRAKRLREVLDVLRPDQLRVVKRLGWDRGLLD